VLSIFSYAHVFDLWGIHGNDLLLKSTTFCLAYFMAKKGEKNVFRLYMFSAVAIRKLEHVSVWP
jgi:hypothetical protein